MSKLDVHAHAHFLLNGTVARHPNIDFIVTEPVIASLAAEFDTRGDLVAQLTANTRRLFGSGEPS